MRAIDRFGPVPPLVTSRAYDGKTQIDNDGPRLCQWY